MLIKFTKTLEKILATQDNVHTIAIGTSGGSDSLALTFLTQEWVAKKQIKIIALIVNHNLRTESYSEAKQTAKTLEENNISYQILTWEHESLKSNIQHQARNARLNLMTGFCKKHNIKHLLLAHTQNDVAENFLMRSLRGSGVFGLASISKNISYNDILIIRPCLDFTKNELQNYLREKNIKWLEDPSNQNKTFFRTNVRFLLSSKESDNIFRNKELISQRLALSSKNLARTRTFIESETAKAKKNVMKLWKEGYITIEYQRFSELHEEIGLNILASCLINISGKHIYKPRLNSLENLYNTILSNKNFVKTLYRCEIKRKDDLLYIYREEPKYGYTIEKKRKGHWIWDHRFSIKLEKNTDIKLISNFDISKLKKYDKAKFNSLPKKIWNSLPQITLKNNEIFAPFLTDTEANGISVVFTSSTADQDFFAEESKFDDYSEFA